MSISLNGVQNSGWKLGAEKPDTSTTANDILLPLLPLLPPAPIGTLDIMDGVLPPDMMVDVGVLAPVLSTPRVAIWSYNRSQGWALFGKGQGQAPISHQQAMQNQINEPFPACLDILRRLPPHQTESNMERLITLRPECEADLRNAVDVPSKVIVCPKTKQEFLACDYNRVGDAYRSPWSQEIVELNGQVSTEKGESLPERLVEMEKLANKAFGSYRQLYYEGGISSAYFWPCETEQEFAFGAAILLQKCVEQEGDLIGARWDSIHVVEVEQQKGTGEATFSMTSTVLLDLNGDFQGIDEFKLNGSLTRQHESTARISNDSGFVSAIGRLVEDMEGRMRSNLQEIYFGKTHEIVNELRPAALPEGFLRNQGDFRDEMRQRCGAK